MESKLLNLVTEYLKIRSQIENLAIVERSLREAITRHADFTANSVKLLSNNRLSVTHRYPDVEPIPFSTLQRYLPKGLVALASRNLDLKVNLTLDQALTVIHEIGGTDTDGEWVSNGNIQLKLDKGKIKSDATASQKLLLMAPEIAEVWLQGWLLEKIAEGVPIEGTPLAPIHDWYGNPAYSLVYKGK